MEFPPSLFCSTLITLLLFASYYPRPAISAAHNNFTDLSALLAFKASVGDPLGVLTHNWTTNTSFCSWIGVHCSRRRQRVTALWLRGFSLQGTVSPHLANLSFLHQLILENNTLGGPIPDAIGRLPRLNTLVLERNQLSGAIPPTILNMSSLATLSLARNSLSGPLPQQNHSLVLPQLQWISLIENQLDGTIPPSFARCRKLTLLALSRNNFRGAIPTELASLPELTGLSLGGNNLTGVIPTALSNLTKLNSLDLSSNSLEGGVPIELGSLPNLQVLDLADNHLTGPIPASLCNASMLSILDLSGNMHTGSVPAQLGRNAPLLQFFNLQVNRLRGRLDFITSLSNSRALEVLAFSGNELDGILPDSVGNLSTHLTVLYTDNNRIRGRIPAEIGNLSSLLYLYLDSNVLTGAVPSALSRLRALQKLYLNHNRLDGPIPHELGQLTNLSQLLLESNSLVGSIPDSIGNLSRMQVFTLAANGLSSAIPRSIWSLAQLIDLDLSLNSLNGSLPPEVGSLKTMDNLDLSWNRLSGIIPSALGVLNMMSSLNLSHNSFHGLIPQSFGGLININDMDISSNGLSGAIPESLADLRHLTTLNLSYNMLEGKVPESGVFSNLTVQSLMGNAALCGVSRLGFPPCSTNNIIPDSGTSFHLIKIILPIVASMLLLLACICLILRRRRRRRVKTADPTDASPANDHRLIPYHQLVDATDNFNEANLLGRGSFGSVFRGCLDDGLSVAVKVLNLEIEGASRSFDAECRALRMLRHRNLVKIITTCSNLDFKALVLQFMPGGSLDRWLYSHNHYLDLLQRLTIMMDVALALEYLHDHHVLHCDLKPSNVLLDQNMTAHVADFGIAKLLLIGDSKSVASTNTPGTIGYIAPEYGSTGRVSRRSDVYSYGIMLLEVFTRKKPTDGMFNGESTLRQWVCEAHPVAMAEVVDHNLLRDEYGDERPNADKIAHLHCLSVVIELGLVCSTESPAERIPMKAVVMRLEKIRKEYLAKLATA